MNIIKHGKPPLHPSLPIARRGKSAGHIQVYSSPFQGEVARKRRRGSIDQSSQPVKTDTLILPKGNFPHLSGTQVIDSAAIGRIIGALDSDGRDIPVDYGHESFSSPRAEAAGWLKHDSIYEDSDGLRGKIEWTKQAMKKIQNKKFRFLSPVLTFNPKRSKGRKLFIERLVSVGLTNHPNIPAMKPLLNETQQTEEKMDELLEKLRTALDMPPETAGDKTLASAIKSLEETLPAREELSQIKNALELESSATLDETVSHIETMRADAATDEELPSREEWQAAKDELVRLEQKELSDMVYNAVTAGKLLPAQKEWALGYAKADREGFSAFLANSAPVVEMGRLVTHHAVNRQTEIDPLQEKVNRMLGISRELFDKYNKPGS